MHNKLNLRFLSQEFYLVGFILGKLQSIIKDLMVLDSSPSYLCVWGLVVCTVLIPLTVEVDHATISS